MADNRVLQYTSRAATETGYANLSLVLILGDQAHVVTVVISLLS